MKVKQIAGGATLTYVAVLDEGEEAFSALSDLVASTQFSDAQVTAVGAFERAVVGWFDRSATDYRRITITEQCEVLSLVGDIALSPGDDGRASAHPVLPRVLRATGPVAAAADKARDAVTGRGGDHD
jgi:predicted DNA-binding protein with PD1-like motif